MAKLSKAKSQRIHAKRRLYQRFDIEANRAYLETIVRLIQTGKSVPVEKQSNRITKHEIILEGKKIHAVYDKLRKTVVTVLFPEENDESHSRQSERVSANDTGTIDNGSGSPQERAAPVHVGKDNWDSFRRQVHTGGISTE